MSHNPAMKLTVREAFTKHGPEWKLANSTVNAHYCDVLKWEQLTDNPKLGDIDDRALQAFEEALLKDGCSETYAYRARKTIARIRDRASSGSISFLERMRQKSGDDQPFPKQLDGTLRAFYHLRYKPLKLRGKTDAAKVNIEINLRHFDRFLGRPATLDDLRNDVVGAAMQWFIDRGCANRTANKFRDSMCALWRFASDEDLLRGRPNVEAFIEPTRAPVAWHRNELKRLWKACASQRGTIGGVPAWMWWTALHALAWDTAERITAIMCLTWGEVNLDTRFVRYKAETRKGKRSDNLSRLHPDTVALLRKFPDQSPDQPVLPWTRCAGSLWTYYAALLREAKLPATRDRKFHCLRKSSASWFEFGGGNATDLLGHSSRKVTMKYIDPTICQRQQASDVLFRPDPGEAVALIGMEGGAP